MNAEIIHVGERIPRLRAVDWAQDRQLDIVFDTGEQRRVDLRPALESRRIFIALRSDEALFRAFRLSEYRDALEWPGGEEFSALWLSQLPDIGFSNAAFRDAMQDLGMSLDGMAAALGISRRQVADFRKDKPIPRHIALATRYLLEHAQKTPA